MPVYMSTHTHTAAYLYLPTYQPTNLPTVPTRPTRPRGSLRRPRANTHGQASRQTARIDELEVSERDIASSSPMSLSAHYDTL